MIHYIESLKRCVIADTLRCDREAQLLAAALEARRRAAEAAEEATKWAT